MVKQVEQVFEATVGPEAATRQELEFTSGPVAPSRKVPGGLEPLRGRTVLVGGALGARQATNALRGLEHGWRMLEASGTVGNFTLAAAGGGGAYSGDSYGDSDVYKWLEAVSWQKQRDLTEPVARAFDKALDLLEAAQRPDGYLNTYVQVLAPGRWWAQSNRHEFYNLGHLLQAGVAAARSNGGGRLFEVALRAVDQLERTCTGKANTWNVGHPGIEMSLVELYRVTGEERYLNLGARILEFRGERKDVLVGSGLSEWEDVLLPMPWEPELTGHAVCAAYLVAGMTDLLTELGDERVEGALDAKWQDMVLRKSYITGNIGSRHAGEAVGVAFELPSGRAYCETCAGIGLLMWCWRLLLLRGEPRYADYFEKLLYNSVLCGASLDGTRFFYANPLEDPGNLERSLWYRCSCCPTNVMRLFAQLEHYVATQGPSGVQIHQYAPARVVTTLERAGVVGLLIATQFPIDGAVSVRIEEPGSGEWELSIRVPSWCVAEPVVRLNGEVLDPCSSARPGYVNVRRAWSKADEVSVDFAMGASFVEANWRSHDQRGTLAVVRGPIVYCAEGHDQAEGLDLSSVRVLPGQGLREWRRAGTLGEHVALRARMKRASHSSEEFLYRTRDAGRPPAGRVRLTGAEEDLSLIPYFLWANRGKSPMRVWFDVPDIFDVPADMGA